MSSNRFATDVPAVDALGRVHLIGIGGAGMSVIASLLLERGVPVQGSDAQASTVLDGLSAQGILTWVGHDAAHICGADTIVISSAVRETNPEVAAARAAGLRVLHRSQALAALMADSRAVAVAGAHGKTTTSAMLAVILREVGLDPSFAIGSSIVTPTGHVSGGHLGTGDVIVAEADESDGSFLNYAPQIAIVTNVEPDHLDHYGSTEAFEQAFVQFAQRIRLGGWLVACADDDGASRLAQAYRALGGRVLTYGFDPGSDVRLGDYRAHAPGGSVTLTYSPRGSDNDGDGVGDAGAHANADADAIVDPDAYDAADVERGTGRTSLTLAVPGLYNALNASAAIAGALLLGVPLGDAVTAIGHFTGTGRRFERLGGHAGVSVVDDYAHHPTEVAALLCGARSVTEQDGGRVVVLFQPHLFSRTRIFAAEFAQALDLADVVVVTDIYGARESPEEGVTGDLITSRMNRAQAMFVPDRFEAAHRVAELARPGDLVLTVGAGNVTELGPVILTDLAKRST